MARKQIGKQLEAGQQIAPVKVDTIDGRTIGLPDPERLVHLQFRRFAGCPICNLHLRSFAARADEVAAAGVHEVVLFHSAAEKLTPFPDLARFDTVADPERTLYDAYGVGTSIRSELSIKALSRGVYGMLTSRPRKMAMGDGILGMPADLLIDSDGTVVDCHYGSHAYDQWTVDEVVARAASATA